MADGYAASQRRDSSPVISSMARNLTRTGSVHDILYDSARKFAENIEAKKREIEASELAQLKSPSINKHSQQLKREGKVHDRLFKLVEQKKSWLESARSQTEAKEEAELATAFSPAINSGSQKRRQSRVEDLCLQWFDEVRDRTEKERERLQQAEAAELRNPTISERSRKLAEKARAEQKQRVEDALLARAESVKRTRESIAEIEFISSHPGYPNITDRAASMVRHGDIGERLFRMSRDREAKLEAMREEAIRQKEPPARPQTAPDRRIELDLLKKAQEMEERKQAERARIEAEEAARHRPQINPRSAVLEQRKAVSSRERLLQSPAPRDTAPQTPSSSFKPQLNPSSVALVESKRTRPANIDDRINEWLKTHKQRVEKIESEAKKKEEQELKECTFRPCVSPAPKAAAENVTVSSAAVEERLKSWRDRRDKRLERERERKEQLELQHCTFQPHKQSTFTSRKSKPKAWGFDEFVQRQRKGRETREAAQQVPHATGENWSPTPTKPQAFQFRTQVRVPALDKPVSVEATPHRTHEVRTPHTAASISYGEFTAALRSAWDDHSDTDDDDGVPMWGGAGRLERRDIPDINVLLQ